MKQTWWKEAVVYQIYPRSFKDSNADGIGDLQGIVQQLDYLQKLGVDVIWVSPIFPSPNDDNGYDIKDYRGIMPEFGNMDDFDNLLQGVHARGMKLVLDLVVNHSSDEHPWFEASRASEDNPYRDYYYWKKEKPNNWKSFFGGDAWDYDATTDSYYLHLFTRKQPDLNWENPTVRQEVYELMRFWLDKGVDGFRMDVISLISKRLAFEDADLSDFNKVVEEVYANGPRIHEFLQEMHQEVLQHYDIMTVGESPGVPPDMANDYVGENRGELQTIFHFGHMFLDHGPGGKWDIVPWDLPRFKGIFQTWDTALGTEGWGSIFLDNHDFPRLVSRWGNDKKYRIESAKMLATLVLTLRGTPYIYQGSELGMTNVAFPSLDDYRDVETLNSHKIWKEEGRDLNELLKAVHKQGRDNVRTPMQWNTNAHAGFTTGQPWIQINPNYESINAEAVLADPDSIFYYYQKLLTYRKQHKTLVYGEYTDLAPQHPILFAYTRRDESDYYCILLNFSDDPQTELPFPEQVKWIWAFGNYPETGINTPLRPWEARVLHTTVS